MLRHHWLCPPVPYLAEAPSAVRVTHFALGAGLVAVTWPAVGVSIETGGAAVTLAANDVVLASEWGTQGGGRLKTLIYIQRKSLL